MIVDMHVHCAELEDIDRYANKIAIVCVSDDLTSSRKVVELSRKYARVEPCVGIHPWNAHEYSVQDANKLLRDYIEGGTVKCLGEVGLDKAFRPDTLNKQKEIFNFMIAYAKEYDLVLNLHAAGAWRDVFEAVYLAGVNRAFFHWYTGPTDLLSTIQGVGYFIGINPAWLVQPRHRQILDVVDLGVVITESDAPYKYRGIELRPELIEKTLSYLSATRKVDINTLESTIYGNFVKLFKRGN